MPSWPGTLPQSLMTGASIKDDESRLISAMDSGPSSVRNRFTAITKIVKGNLLLTGTQLGYFFTFFQTTLSHGVLTFDWVSPVDGSAVVMRFKSKPEWTCVKSNSDASKRLWQAQLELEVQP